MDVSYTLPRAYFTYIPATFKAGEDILYTDFIYINIDSLLSANGLSGGTVNNPVFTSVSVTITAPAEANFGWLQSASAITANNAGFLPSVQVANVVNSGGTGKTVVLTVNGSVIPIGSTGFYIRILGTLTGPVPQEWINMYMDGTLKLTLQAL